MIFFLLLMKPPLSLVKKWDITLSICLILLSYINVMSKFLKTVRHPSLDVMMDVPTTLIEKTLKSKCWLAKILWRKNVYLLFL